MGISLGYYGMGWFVEKHDQTTILSHTGTVPDFFAFMALLPEQDKGMVLLINANHAIMDKLSLSSVGMDAAQLLAGETPKPTRVGATPWVLRGLLLIPILQFLSVVMTLRRIRRWQVEPDSRPSNERKWVRHILLPLIPNLAMLALPLLFLTN
jgi:hypothetical protein